MQRIRWLVLSIAPIAFAIFLSAFSVALFPAPAFATGVQIICTEDAADGCVTTIPTSSPALTVASDGESSFDPFNFGHDTSDGIKLNSNWTANNNHGAFNTGLWTQIPNTSTWVLPASIPNCGSENEPSCQPIGSWFFSGTPGSQWASTTPSEVDMLSPTGTISDQIFLDNNGPGGSAEILFQSDIVPEPSTLALMSTGLLGGVGLIRRKKLPV